jgi:hypothetical protein
VYSFVLFNFGSDVRCFKMEVTMER